MKNNIEKELENTVEFNNTKFKERTYYLDKKDLELTLKQRKFAFYYIMTNENHTKAAKMAGYSEKGIDVRCSLLLSSIKIREAIKIVIENELGKEKEKLEYNIFKKLKAILESDILDYVDEQGNLKKRLSDIPKYLRQCIKKIEPKYYGKDAGVRVLTVELMGKEFAMQTLMKYINMVKEDKNNENTLTDETLKSLLNKLRGE